MTRTSTLLAAIVAFTIGSTGVLADDIRPPWWRDKNPDHVVNRSTLQWWEFGTPDDQPLAEPGFDSPPSSIDPQAGISPGAPWIDDDPDSSRQGIWPLSDDEFSGVIFLSMSNYPGGPEKKIWLQLTWKPREYVPPADPLGSPDISVTTSESIIPVPGDLQGTIPLAEGWIHSTYQIVVQPNPLFESITISGDILVDSAVVDTICPEPATLALLGLGFPLLARRRRKSRN